MGKRHLFAIIVIILTFFIGIFTYNILPEQIASHWNANGEVDGYMNKFAGLFLLPIFTTIIFLLLIFLPKIDPIRKDAQGFRKEYDTFVFVFTLYMLVIYIFTILWNLGIKFEMGKFILITIALLFFYLAKLIEKSKRNWFIGIRTPWTLSSDKVWEKTHEKGGIIFRFMSLLFLIYYLS